MSRVFKLTVLCCCIAGLTSAAFGHPTETRMFWVGPDGDPTNYASGTTILYAAQGDTVHVELWYQGWDGVTFQSNAVQAFFDATLNPSGGPVQNGQVIVDCSSAAVNNADPDYAGFTSITVSVPPLNCPSVKAGFVLLNLNDPFDVPVPGAPDGAYFGEIDFVVDADACGEFVSYYVGTPDLETIIVDDTNTAQLNAIFDVLQINVMPPNDLCADAIALASGVAAPYDTTCGGAEAPDDCGADADVYFTYVSDCDAAEITIAVAGGGSWGVYDDGCAQTSQVGACDVTSLTPADFGLVGVIPAGEVLTIQLSGVDVSGTITADCVSACTANLPAGSATTNTECDPTGTLNTDPCLMWFCESGVGCTLVSTDPNDAGNTTDGVACDDDLFCTIDDACDTGVCVGGGAYDCDDGALCTIDFCCEEIGDPTFPPFTCGGADECVSIDINDIPCSTIGDCPAEAADCIGGFCVCVENPALCLNVDTQPGKNCLDGVGVGDEVIVTVDMAFSTSPICAAQFFLQYDTSALDFNSITPGGGVFNTVLLEEVDEVAGTIDYIVGENPGAICFGTNGPATVATISFTAIAQCKNEGVCFRGHNPPTILGAADGSAVCPLGHLRAPGDPLIEAWGYDCGLAENPIAEPCCTGPFSIDITPPEMNCPDFKTYGNADCGTVTRTVFWDPLWAVDKCDGAIPVVCTISHNGGADVQHLLAKNGGAFPPGITTIDCDGTTDACNNVTECVFSVGNSGLNGIHLEVELSPTMDAGPLNRGIEFSVTDCGGIANAGDPYLQCVDVNLGYPFNIPGHGVAQAKVPPGNWMCIEAWDPLHTLNATCGMTCEVLPQKGSVWFASFKGSKDLSDTCHWLVNGNLNGDIHIDVLDYVTYLACVADNPTPDADTYCGDPLPHCDINGDGLVSLLDFSFILVNLFNDAKAGCDAVCNPSATPQDISQGVESISVRALIESGVDARVARTADVNNDGSVDETDLTLYLNGGTDNMVRDQSIKGSRR